MKINKKNILLILLALFSLGGIIYGALSGIHRFTHNTGTDFNVFYIAGKAVAQGNAAELYTVHTARGPGFSYIYLPLFALFMAPLGMLNITLASWIWTLLNILMIIHSIKILSELFNDKSIHFYILIAASSVFYLSENLLLGQVHILILYLAVLMQNALVKGKHLSAGAYLAAASVLKLIPIVFAGYLFLTGRWKALMATIVGIALMVFIIPSAFLGFKTNTQLVSTFYDIQLKPFISAENNDAGIYARTAKQKTLNDQDLGALLMRHFSKDHYFIEELRTSRFKFLNIVEANTSSVRKLMFVGFLILLLCPLLIYIKRKDWKKPLNVEIPLFIIFTLLSVMLSPRIRLCYLSIMMIPFAYMISRYSIHLKKKSIKANFLNPEIIGLGLILLTTLLFSFPLFRAMTILYYGLTAIYFSVLYNYFHFDTSEPTK